MDMTRIKQLAGINTKDKEFKAVFEVVQLTNDLTMDDLIARLDACRRALAIVNKMQDPADRKKWLSATFVNLNKVRGALQQLMNKEGLPAEGHPSERPPSPRPAGSAGIPPAAGATA